MMRSSLSLWIALLALFAGHVMAINITISGSNITAVQFLQSTDPVRQDCKTQCDPAQTTISACTDDTCLCSNATAAQIQTCEQCMFNNLIARNKKPDDGKAGQTSAITAYKAGCAIANPNINFTALASPPDWDGPFGQGLTTGTTVVAVGACFILGVFSIAIVNTM